MNLNICSRSKKQTTFSGQKNVDKGLKEHLLIIKMFLARFDDRYWVMFQMAKSMFFPQFQGRNSQFKEQTKLELSENLTKARCSASHAIKRPSFPRY